MKNNRNFITLFLSLALIAPLLLAGCDKEKEPGVLLPPPDNTETLITDTSEQPKTEIETKGETKTPEEIIREKIDAYTFETEENTIQFFSEEQAKLLTASRKSGDLFALTREEIDYIIKDSVALYFSKDQIILTKGTDSGFIPSTRRQQTEDYIIPCYHGDYREFEKLGGVDYNDVQSKHKQILNHLFDMVVYRIGMLDSTFVKTEIFKSIDNSYWLTTEYADPVRLTESGKFIPADDPISTRWIKLCVETEDMTREEYLDLVLQEKDMIYTSYFFAQPDSGFKEVTPPQNTLISAIEGQIFRQEEQSSATQPLYPVEDIEQLAPDWNILQKIDPKRKSFEEITAKIYPEYDISTPTVPLSIKDYRFGINGDGNSLRTGMSYKELVDTFGIPYEREFFSGEAYYNTKKGKIYFRYSPIDYSVTQVNGEPGNFTLDPKTQSLIVGKYDVNYSYQYYIQAPGIPLKDFVGDKYWRYLPYVTDELVRQAAEKLKKAVENAPTGAKISYNFQGKDGYLCLMATVTSPTTDGHYSGTQRTTYFEKISTQALPYEEFKGW